MALNGDELARLACGRPSAMVGEPGAQCISAALSFRQDDGERSGQ